MSDDPIQKIRSAAAWAEFCDVLKQAGAVLLREDIGASDFERAEGHRYLTRLLRAGFESFAEHPGPLHPEFRTLPRLVKMGLDNPDNYYLSASVSGRRRYRIRGRRGTIHYLSFAAQSQNFAARERITGGAGHLNDAELALSDDGAFEIIASLEKPDGVDGQAGARRNWLPLAADTTQILVRQTYLDREREQPVSLDIECLDAEGPPAPLDPARVTGQLLGAAHYAIGCANWFADWVLGFDAKGGGVNRFHLPGAENHRLLGGDPNIVIPLGRFELAADEALLIEVKPPRCDYWNVQLANIWAESLDARGRQTHLNCGSAQLEADGRVRIIVAHEDPGHPNWLDTAGHSRGIMGFRWVRADAHPLPETRLLHQGERKVEGL